MPREVHCRKNDVVILGSHSFGVWYDTTWWGCCSWAKESSIRRYCNSVSWHYYRLLCPRRFTRHLYWRRVQSTSRFQMQVCVTPMTLWKHNILDSKNGRVVVNMKACSPLRKGNYATLFPSLFISLPCFLYVIYCENHILIIFELP
jgi:hypothetical protein